MSGYSGEVDIEFVIERYKNPVTFKLMVEDESDENTLYEQVEITLKVEGSSYFTPGKFSGPPENCDPDEGETEVISIVDSSGKDWYDLVTASEMESIKEAIDDAVQNIEPDIDEEDDEEDDYEEEESFFEYDPFD
jgi:hypothetical protein